MKHPEKMKKNNCIEDLKVYYGIEPYFDHVSHQSGFYYQWLKIKYGKQLIKKCEEELGVSRI